MKALFRFMLVLAVVPVIWSCSDDDDGTSDTTRLIRYRAAPM